jgi:ribosomal protein S18 acetylase RimI-like enzyme
MMDLIKELALYEKAPEQVTVDFNHFLESGFGNNPVWWAYVAEVTNEDQSKLIVGFALYYIRYSTWKGQRMYLEDIIVTEKWRGKGIGKMLFDELIKVCKEKEFKGIIWQVLDWNEPAINFYKKFKNVTFDGEWVNCSIDSFIE